MRRKILICGCLLLTLIMAGCNQNTTNKKLTVYASFYPLYDFAKNIGKDKIEVKLVVPSGIEPHEFQINPRKFADICSASMFIYDGLGLEPWAEKLLPELKDNNVEITKSTIGIKLLKRGVNSNDPHAWLDPTNAIIECENIKNSLIKIDKKNIEFYEQNFQTYKKELLKVDKAYKEGLSKRIKNEIISSHSAFSYLASKYNFKQISICGISSENEPSSVDMAKICRFAKENNIKYILYETLKSPKLSNVIAEEIGGKTKVLNPIEGLSEEEIKNGENYLSKMYENLETLELVLGEK